MTPLVWANFPLMLLFVLAIVGIPMWMIFKRPVRAPDHSEALGYLRAKAELQHRAGLGVPAPAQVTTMATAAAPVAPRKGRWQLAPRKGRWQHATPEARAPRRRPAAAHRSRTRIRGAAAGRRRG